ncbi:MAG: hypothetical protein C0601_00025 [Candidatus Muiribacterium halophilum]|uniref:Uncharacterized protein n=1 Tax=Muiribacterium halophilum TaxID=2053465 RepID=A0A2N5ZNG9_MUIH1|nr:MAG: hypothetical protein C0601_00025 [Candidatus Muirbacterium halophilum]
MFFKKKAKREIIQKFHSIQKKTIKLVSLCEKSSPQSSDNTDSQFFRIFNTSKDIFNIINLKKAGNRNDHYIQNMSLIYMNINTTLYNIFFLYRPEENSLIRDYLDNVREILEIYESVMFHLLERPNISRENYGKRELFQERILKLIKDNKSEEKREAFAVVSQLETELNTLELLIKKIVY